MNREYLLHNSEYSKKCKIKVLSDDAERTAKIFWKTI